MAIKTIDYHYDRSLRKYIAVIRLTDKPAIVVYRDTPQARFMAVKQFKKYGLTSKK